MKLSLQLPTDRMDRLDEFVTGDAVAEMARAAEAAGFDSVAVTEHPFPDDEWMASGGHHALDPLVALAFAAAATTRLRLRTNLMVLAYRNPFMAAKGVASLDQLSGGRTILGIGTGYLEAEFDALGVPFAARNERTDEAIVAMKRAWTESGVAMSGEGWQARANTMLPRPAQRPHPPIWVGGNSKRAARRAVELGDGWLPFPNARSTVERRHTPAIETLDDLRAGIAFARDHAAAIGRTEPFTVSFPLGGIQIPTSSEDPVDLMVEMATQLASVGVTDLGGGVRRTDTRADFLAEVARAGETFVPRISAVEPR